MYYYCTCRVQVQSGYQDDLSDFQKLKGVSINTTDYGISNNTGFCRGSASVPRELILSTQVNASHGGGLSASCMSTGLGDKAYAFQEKNCDTHSQLDMV